MSTTLTIPDLAKRRPREAFEFIECPDFFGHGHESGWHPIIMRLPESHRPHRWLVCEAKRTWQAAIQIKEDMERGVEVRAGQQNWQTRKAWFFRTWKSAARKFTLVCSLREAELKRVFQRSE